MVSQYFKSGALSQLENGSHGQGHNKTHSFSNILYPSAHFWGFCFFLGDAKRCLVLALTCFLLGYVCVQVSRQ